jgi:hypothetical protein
MQTLGMLHDRRLVLNFILLATAGTIIGILVSTASVSATLGWLTLMVGLVIVFSIAQNHPSAAKPLLIAFGVRALLTLAHRYITPLPDSQADALWYQSTGLEWAQYGLAGVFERFRTGAYLYVWAISLLYALTEQSPLMIQGVNVLFGSLVVWNVFRISELLWSTKIATRAAWIAALFPTLALYSSIAMREVAIVYPLTLSVLFLLRWYQGGKDRYLVFSVVCLVVSLAFHTAILVLFGIWGVLVVYKWSSALRGRRGAHLLRLSAILLVFGGLLVAIVLSGWGLDKLSLIRSPSTAALSVDSLSDVAERAARGRAAYLEGSVFRRPLDFVVLAPLRLAYFLFAPFFWMNLSPEDLFALLDSLLYVWLALGLYRSRHYIRTNPTALAVLLVLLALVTTFALFTSNYGTAVRHRSKVVAIAISLMVVMPWQLGSRRMMDSLRRHG